MRPKGANSVGRFSVEFEIANNDDLALVRRGLLPADQVRREVIHGVVDSGATRLVLPEASSSGSACRWAQLSTFAMPTAAAPSVGR